MALTMDDLLSKTTDLPSIPSAALAAIQEADNPLSSVQSIAEHICLDQSLTARILRLANSSYYGLPRQVATIPDAVVVLGTRTVRNLCLIAATYPWMIRAYPGYDLGPKQMWRHALGTAVASTIISEQAGLAKPDACFTAGLLHDIGKTAISIWLENKIHAVQSLAHHDNASFDETERKVLGFDHCEVGAALGEAWNLPPSLIEVIRYHHNPSASPQQSPLLYCVHLGDYITMAAGIGVGGDGLRYRFDDASLNRLGLVEANLDEVMDKFLDQFSVQESKLGGLDE